MHSFNYATFINTTPEKLWRAITETTFLEKYWGVLVSDWQVGSELTMYTDQSRETIGFIGRVLESQAPEVLSYTFHPQDSEEAKAADPSKVTFRIEPYTDVVKLVITHEEITHNFDSLEAGWQAILSNLKTFVETGETLPDGIWDWHRDRGLMCGDEEASAKGA